MTNSKNLSVPQVFCKPYKEMTLAELEAEKIFWYQKTFDQSDWLLVSLAESYLQEVSEELVNRNISA